MGWSWEGAFSSPDLILICCTWAALMEHVVPVPGCAALQGALCLLGLLCASGTGRIFWIFTWSLLLSPVVLVHLPSAQRGLQGWGWRDGEDPGVRLHQGSQAGTFPAALRRFCSCPALWQSCMQPDIFTFRRSEGSTSTFTSCGSNLSWNELFVCRNAALTSEILLQVQLLAFSSWVLAVPICKCTEAQASKINKEQ